VLKIRHIAKPKNVIGYFNKPKSMRRLIFVLTSILLISCNGQQDIQNEKTYTANLFHTFIRKFKIINLPYKFRDTEVNSENFTTLKKVDKNSADTLFVKTDYPDETYCYGILSDTSIFYTLIYYFPADFYYPVVVTYTKKGEPIDQKSIIANGCGVDCGLTYCSETGIINTDYSIFCTDTLDFKFMCDTLSQPIPNSETLLTNTRTGKITKTGKIIMTEIQHRETKKNSL
jgi:hypothetical protein